MDEFQAYAVGLYEGDDDGFGKNVDVAVREVGMKIREYCEESIFKKWGNL
jgi:hypothetical protein